MKIGILHHPQVPDSYELAQEIEAWLRDQDVESWECSSWEAGCTDDRLEGLELLIALGGDGSMLRAGRLASHFDVPILGINMGRLGFLAEIYPDEWRKHMPRVISGDYRIERRHMLQAEVWRNGELIEQGLEVLNEVVVARGNLTRVVRITTEINDSYLTTYVADGVIVSTPTGSTAYALAVGGPILPPELRNILLLPIAPHLSLARPIVLDKGAIVTMNVHTDHNAILTVDGQFLIDMEDGDRVVVASGPNVASFVRLQPRSYFYRTLQDRLKWIV